MSRLSSSDHGRPVESIDPAPESVKPFRNGTGDASAKSENQPAPDAHDATSSEEISAQAQNDQTKHQSGVCPEPSSMDRVEELMENVGKKVGSFTSKIGQHLYRLAAHARETAEDCWAEAQSIRRGEKNEPPPS